MTRCMGAKATEKMRTIDRADRNGAGSGSGNVGTGSESPGAGEAVELIS
jgi:hypothetical protein